MNGKGMGKKERKKNYERELFIIFSVARLARPAFVPNDRGELTAACT